MKYITWWCKFYPASHDKLHLLKANFDDSLSRCRYEGTWSKGLRDGHGKCKYACEDLYDGAWSNDMRAGSGTCAYANGDKYTGEPYMCAHANRLCILPNKDSQ